jgi:hypothetical protein
MSRKRIKQYLVLLTAVGVIAIVAASPGTFASFSAETTNAGNTFVTGTLFLHNTADGTTCTSETNTSTNTQVSGCDILFNGLGVSNGTELDSSPLTLNDAGTIDATDIKFGITAQDGSTGNCAVGSANAGGSSTTFGTVNCSNFELAIEELDGTGASPTVVGCAYGTAATSGNGCQFDASHTLGTAGISNGGSVALQLVSDQGSNSGTKLSAGESRYFRIMIKPVVAQDNYLQNRSVGFGLNWHIDQ